MTAYFILAFLIFFCDLSTGCKVKITITFTFSRKAQLQSAIIDKLEGATFEKSPSNLGFGGNVPSILGSKSDQRNLDTLFERKTSNYNKVEAFQKLAFKICNSDGIDGLSWTEIEDCEEKFCGSNALVADCPTKSDFNHFDTNKDGILLFSEWKSERGINNDLKVTPGPWPIDDRKVRPGPWQTDPTGPVIEEQDLFSIG